MNIIKVVNYIRQNSSDAYKKAVKVIKANTSITDFSAMLDSYSLGKNEFAKGLSNMIGSSILTSIGDFKSPVDKYKTAPPSTGVDIREIANGLIEGQKFDFSTTGIAEMFKIHESEFAECYHRLNRQNLYPITISKKELKLALTSWDNLEQLINEKMVTLTESNKYDEFQLFIDLVNETVSNENVKVIEIDEVKDNASGLAFIETVKNVVSSFQYRDSTNCIYGNKNKNTKIKPICNKENCSIIMPYALGNKLDVNSMASAFNMDKLKYKTDTYTEVQTLGYIKREVTSSSNPSTTETVYYAVDALISDKGFFIIKDDEDNGVDTNELPTIRAYNCYLHIWQWWSTSPFRCVNALVHKVESSEIPDGYFE